MASENATKICIICREVQNKYVKIEGIFRIVIFELLSDISDLEIKDDNSLPTSICCNCSVQLQLAKSTLDKLKQQEKCIKIHHPLQCYQCQGPIAKHLAINVFDRQKEKIGKCLADVIKEISHMGDLQSTTNVCRPCAESLSSFATIKALIIASNAKRKTNISSQIIDDPLGGLLIPEEYLENQIASEESLPDVLANTLDIETLQTLPEGQHEVFIRQLPLQDVEERPNVLKTVKNNIKKVATHKSVRAKQNYMKTKQSKSKQFKHQIKKCLKSETTNQLKSKIDEKIMSDDEDSDKTLSCDEDNSLIVKMPENAIKSNLKTFERIHINSEEILNDPKLKMISTVRLTRLNETNEIYVKSEPVEHQTINNKKVKIEIVADSKPKTSSIPIITAVVSLHSSIITQENPQSDYPTPENIDSNFEFFDEFRIFCKTCNRVMNLSNYKHHIYSKYHKFFIDFPEFRSEKRTRQQRVRECQLFINMKLWCDICCQYVKTDNWRKHVACKMHQFLFENPEFRSNKKRGMAAGKKTFHLKDVSVNEMKRKIRSLICDFCRKTFRVKEVLEKHIKRHCKSFYTSECEFCNEKFFSSYEVAKHSRKNHSDTKGNYECKDCKKSFQNLQLYHIHTSSYNHLLTIGKIPQKERKTTYSKPFKCSICNLKLRSQPLLSLHMSTCHSDEDLKDDTSNEIACKLCQRQFDKSNDSLTIHYIMDHKKSETEHILHPERVLCQCGKMIVVGKFKAHHENLHPTSTVCTICGESFENVEEFRHHRDFGHREYLTCDVCSTFKTQSRRLMTEHQRHHNYTYQKFVCEFCGYSCRHKHRFDFHLSKHQIENTYKSKQEYIQERRKNKCDQCDKAYVDRKDLRTHQKYVHEGLVRPYLYSCQLCSLKFYKRNKYNMHLNSVTHSKNTDKILNEN